MAEPRKSREEVVVVSVKLPRAVYDRLRKEAKAQDRSVSALVRLALTGRRALRRSA